MTAPPARMTVASHLSELRTRAFWIICSVIVFSLIAYSQNDKILELLISPLNQPLYYTSPAGGLTFVLKLSVLCGLIFSFPAFFYHTFRFLQPILPKNVTRRIGVYICASTVLLGLGALIAYTVILPSSLAFFQNFSSSHLQALISTNEYLLFTAAFMLGFGITFQLPLVMVLINSVKRIKGRSLLRYEKYVLIASFLVAAVLTPTPDVQNQILMALPIIALYQVSIVLIYLINRKKRFKFKYIK